MKWILMLPVMGMALGGATEPQPFADRISDDALQTMRGGFTLPNGLDVNLSVITTTMVDGGTVLRSVFRLDSTASLDVFVAEPGAPVHAPSTSGSGSVEKGAPPLSFSYDPQNGLSIAPTAPRVNISVGAARPEHADPGAGLNRVDVAPGQSVATPDGTVSLSYGQVRFDGDRLSTVHLFGDAIGSLTVNTGNDRTIDTSTTISLELAKLSPDVIGSVLLRAEGLALDATGMLVR
jgi:hypothetical protein